MITLAVLLSLALAQAPATLEFEEPWPSGDAPPGWTAVHGAGREGGTPSRIECAPGGARKSKHALRLSGDAGTGSWRYLAQTMTAVPGERWTLRVAVKSEDVRREDGQFGNAYVRMAFLDESGERLGDEITPMVTGTREWTDLVLDAIVPERAATVELAAFLSMSGALWVDELRLVRSPLAPFDDKKVREAAIDALSDHMLRTYPFFDYRGKPTHAKVFKKLRAKAIKSKSVEDMADEIKKAFDELEDLHLKLRVGGETIRTGPRGNPNPTNWNFDAVAEHFERVVSEGDTHVVARLKENVGYVRLASFSADDAEIARADRAMDELTDVAAWIIDVRPNGGGSESQGELFAARFVSEDVEYARQVYRDAFAIDDETAFTQTSSRWIQPREGRVKDERPVVVLMGPYCVSSTEGFLFMLDALPNATLVGKPSRGSSANPASYVVVPGLEVVVPRWRAMTLEDECIEGVGIQPDVVVDERPSKYLKADPTFERGLLVLAK